MNIFIKSFLLALFFVFITVFSVINSYAAVTWQETQPAGDTNQYWDGGAVSQDGTTMVALTQDTAVYLSTDSGANWSEVSPTGGVAYQWQTAAISSNGQVIAVGGQSGMYVSTNQGADWTQVLSGADATNFTSVSMSPDGQYMIGGSYGGRLYTSINSGTSWSERRPEGNADKSWQTTAISSDGQNMIAGIFNGRLYSSVDGGDNWEELQIAGDADQPWWVSNMSSDGQKILIGMNGGRLYLSLDGGSSWNETRPGGNVDKDWSVGSMSTDGEVIFVGAFYDRLYISNDGGTSWSETQPEGNTTKYWRLASVSHDGETLLAAHYLSGRIFLGENPPVVPTPTPTPTPQPQNNNSSDNSSSNIDPCPGYVVCPNANTTKNTPQSVSSGEGGGTIVLPSVPGFMELNVSVDNPSFGSLLSGQSVVPVPWSQGLNTAGNIINFSARSAFNGYPVTELAEPAILMMKYDPTKLNGKSPNQLRLGWFNPNTKRWQILKSNTVIKANENLIANTSTSLGYYAVVLPISGSASPVLGAKTEEPIVAPALPVVDVTPKPSPQVSAKPQAIQNATTPIAKKRCFLFICW